MDSEQYRKIIRILQKLKNLCGTEETYDLQDEAMHMLLELGEPLDVIND